MYNTTAVSAGQLSADEHVIFIQSAAELSAVAALPGRRSLAQRRARNSHQFAPTASDDRPATSHVMTRRDATRRGFCRTDTIRRRVGVLCVRSERAGRTRAARVPFFDTSDRTARL